MKKYLIVGLLMIILVMVIVSANGNKMTNSKPYTEQNLLTFLPQTDIFGKPIDYNKKLYVVDVWATWCPPCRETIPELITLQNQFKDKNFTVIGLSVDLKDTTVLDFAMQYGINYPVAMAGDSLKALPPVRGIPTLFLMDNKGKILKTHIGYTQADVLANEVKRELK